MSLAVIRHHAPELADLFLGVAHANGPATDAELSYVCRQLEELLAIRELPESLRQRMAAFDSEAFDVEDAGAAMRDEPPMRPRRLLELVAFVAVADGSLDEPEDVYIRKLGASLGVPLDEYRDLTLDHESRGPRRTFTQMAVVQVPPPKSND